ncbi:lipoprotein [Sulfuriferula plumbiphila]|uniref:Lipoprotein n=2 Tax=Sulfuriferula plumbiphila TaxID=171865 RepID=A0A512L742_9PROT|nr:lipoprotein [Sulfuriferula plumbiphila]GEP30267.1 lipoprotein [Sulfuriferula plumbiphila]
MVMLRLARFLFLFLVLVLTGCGEKQPVHYLATDITGVGYARDFRLTDQTGKVRTLADFRGKVVAIFFGYTHCPDVCPATLSDFAMAMKLLGKDAARVQVIFVTLDPERDTRAVLAHYVPAFNPGFLGMYADPAGTAALAKAFKVFYQKQPADGHGRYAVDHSAGTYIYDTQGRLRLYMAYGQGPPAIAHDISLLLKD